ncbi:hypothetical protein O6H91_Y437800 [Diphasiastrum complanatum]|nr:hypothetical protein O6H91_Y437800 [Diphasiastrum complanatum]
MKSAETISMEYSLTFGLIGTLNLSMSMETCQEFLHSCYHKTFVWSQVVDMASNTEWHGYRLNSIVSLLQIAIENILVQDYILLKYAERVRRVQQPDCQKNSLYTAPLAGPNEEALATT